MTYKTFEWDNFKAMTLNMPRHGAVDEFFPECEEILSKDQIILRGHEEAPIVESKCYPCRRLCRFYAKFSR